MTIADRQPPNTTSQESQANPNSISGLALWSVVAAFGAYFCMYAFRKPFTAATFADANVWGLGEKTVLVTAQVLGYMLSKIIGIRVIAEMPPQRRALGILVLIGVAELALLLFAIAPSPLHVFCLFLNGLPLGMVFGLVLGHLEGRKYTEALAAGLCSSFILADGIMKTLGTWLLDQGVSERWMPGAAGLIFLPPLLGFVWMLSRIPPPDARDIALRSQRWTMNRLERLAMLRRYGFGLSMLVLAYLLVTIARSLRADFAPEIWNGLGVEISSSLFSRSEILVALVVLVVNGLGVLIIDNKKAFFSAIGVALCGGALMLLALVGLQQSWISGFPFMVLMGLGLYLPYVAMHTTIFERLIALTKERGNLGFLMYLADSAGYIGYVALMIGKGFFPTDQDFLGFFLVTCGVIGVFCCLCLAACWRYFAQGIASPERLEPKS